MAYAKGELTRQCWKPARPYDASGSAFSSDLEPTEGRAPSGGKASEKAGLVVTSWTENWKTRLGSVDDAARPP